MAQFKELKNEHLGECISTIAYDGIQEKYAIGVLDERLLLKDKTLETLHTFKGNLGIVDASFKPDGTRLAFTTMDYSIKVIDMEQKSEITNIECNPMEAWKVRFWKDRIVTAGDQGKVFVYDAATGEVKNDYKFGDAFITCIAVNGKNDLVLTNALGEIGVYGDGKFNAMPTEHKKYIRAAAYQADNNHLVLASDDLRISVMDLHQGKAVHKYSGHQNLVNCLDCHPGEPLFVTGSNDKTVKVWDTRQAEAVDTVTTTGNTPIWGVRFGNRGRELLVGSENGILTLLS